MTVFAPHGADQTFKSCTAPLKQKERQNIQAVVRIRPKKQSEQAYIECADRIGTTY